MQSMTYRRGGGSSRAVSAGAVDLIDPAGLMVKRIESLRTHAWEVELAAHGIDSASLNASSVQLEATCADLNVLDVASELFDAEHQGRGVIPQQGRRRTAHRGRLVADRAHHRHRTIL